MSSGAKWLYSLQTLRRPGGARKKAGRDRLFRKPARLQLNGSGCAGPSDV